MSVIDSEVSKGTGIITRLTINVPTSAPLWKWSLLLLTIFFPFYFSGFLYSTSTIIAFGYNITNIGSIYNPPYGFFIFFPFGANLYNFFFVGVSIWSLYIPVFITLRSFEGIVKNKERSRIARILIWYYLLLTLFVFWLYPPGSIPLGIFPWFIMYLRYKQLNYWVDTKELKVETVPTSPLPQTAIASVATSEEEVKVTSGYDIAGEKLKLAVKVYNEGTLAILNVTVNLDSPDGFEFVSKTLPSQKIGNISAGSFQSAIFWLKPQRCVDDEYGGSVIFRDAQNESHSIMIPRKRIVNVCPMLEATPDVEGVFKKLKFGSLTRNCATFKFSGSAKTVYELAKSRLRGLDPVDRSEQTLQDGNFLGYACFVGQTKFGDQHFAAEVQTTGTEASGVLTLSIYSDDERILSGYMVDVMQDVREHVEVLEEQACPLATCPKCGADIDPSKIDDSRVYICSYCGGASKAAPWLV